MIVCSYRNSSHRGNAKSSRLVPFLGNAGGIGRRYAVSMFDPAPDWYLKEWLESCGRPPKWLEDETGWTHRITSQLINRKTRWNRDHLRVVAKLLHLHVWELLMHPDEAMHIRRLRTAVDDEHRLRAVADVRREWKGAPKETSP